MQADQELRKLILKLIEDDVLVFSDTNSRGLTCSVVDVRRYIHHLALLHRYLDSFSASERAQLGEYSREADKYLPKELLDALRATNADDAKEA